MNSSLTMSKKFSMIPSQKVTTTLICQKVIWIETFLLQTMFICFSRCGHKARFFFDLLCCFYSEIWSNSESKLQSPDNKLVINSSIKDNYEKSDWSLNTTQRISDLVESMKNYGVLDFEAGIPNSLRNTGQQWDFPNSWPPSTHMIITGLYQSDSAEHQQLAKRLADKWIRSELSIVQESKSSQIGFCLSVIEE